MTPTEEHDDIVRRLENAKERRELAFNKAKRSQIIAYVIFPLFIAPWIPILRSDLLVIHVIVLFVYGLGLLFIWRNLSYCLDPHYREYKAIKVEIESIQKELREFERTHTVVWVRGENPEEKA